MHRLKKSLVLVFVIDLLVGNYQMELNEDIESEHSGSEDPEPTTSVETIDEECFDPSDQTTSIYTNERKTSSSKSKRKCIFNQQWLKDPTYAPFLKKCPANKHFAHCSICKSDFSIANGGIYLLNRHMEQAGHKRLAATQSNEQCKV